MARSGIEKSAVVQARNSLIAMGRHPSIDAIRIELGNTGSKATIHRYLKEIEQEEGPAPGKGLAVSEAIQDLAARLAARLQDEADQKIRDLSSRHHTELAELNGTLAVLRNEFDLLRRQNERLSTQLSAEKTAHGNAQTLLQEEKIASAQMASRIQGLEEQVARNEIHRLSLEEKHQQAFQQSLDAAKTQQAEDQRRFDQQLAFFQDELKLARNDAVKKTAALTESEHEKIALKTNLEQMHQSRKDLENEAARLTEENRQLQSSQQQLTEKLALVASRETALSQAHQENLNKLGEAQARAQASESALMAAQAVLNSQEKILEKLTALQGSQPPQQNREQVD